MASKEKKPVWHHDGYDPERSLEYRGYDWYSCTYPDGITVYAHEITPFEHKYPDHWIASDRYMTLGDEQTDTHHLGDDDNFILRKICQRQGASYQYDPEFDDSEILVDDYNRQTAADRLHAAVKAVKAYIATPIKPTPKPAARKQVTGGNNPKEITIE